MRIGVGTKLGATRGLTEMRIVEVAVLNVTAATRTENPILVRYGDIVEKGMGEHPRLIQRDSIVPTRHEKARARNALIKEVLFVTVFKHIPLRAVDGRLDVIAVLRQT